MSQPRVLNAATLRLRNLQRPSYRQYLDNGEDSDEQMDDSATTDDPEYMQQGDRYNDDDDDGDDDDEVDEDCDDDNYSERGHSDRRGASSRGIAQAQETQLRQDFRDSPDRTESRDAEQTQPPQRTCDRQASNLKDHAEPQQNQMDLRKQIIQIQQDSSVSPQEKAKKIQELMTKKWSAREKGKSTRAALASNRLEDKRKDFSIVLSSDTTNQPILLVANTTNDLQSCKLIVAANGTLVDFAMTKCQTITL
ncbi:hypothetical protein HDU83_003526 [Entophlyctis luteolus]|nr:hypothetical protein HDU83_003526 [Entophlyctis luteolus]